MMDAATAHPSPSKCSWGLLLVGADGMDLYAVQVVAELDDPAEVCGGELAPVVATTGGEGGYAGPARFGSGNGLPVPSKVMVSNGFCPDGRGG